MTEYVEYYALKNLENGKYPIILSENIDDYKFFKKGKNKILLWDPLKEPFVLESSKVKNKFFLELKSSIKVNREKLVELLIKSGYEEYEKTFSEGEFARRGFIIDIFFEEEEYPIRIEFFGDQIEEIRFFDPFTQRKIGIVESVYLYVPQEFCNFFFNLVDLKNFFFIYEKNFLNKKIIPLQKFLKLTEFIEFLKEQKMEVYYVAKENIRYSYYKKLIENLKFLKGEISKSFIVPEENTVVVSEREIYPVLKTSKKFVLPFREESFFEISPGDTVIHEEEGICSIKGIKRIKTEGKEIDYIELIFKDNQKLFIPFWEIHKIEKYFGKRAFTDFSTNKWVKELVRSKIEVHEFAKKLLNLTARRKVLKGISFRLDEEEEKILNEIILSFPFTETDDQRTAWEETKKDMESENRMDRLILGDSGFGKTEIALRASSMCALKGYQALFLAPTTPLVLQHYRNFSNRLKDFPINVKMLSRLLTKSEEKEIIKDLKEGKIDILIATHRALYDDVRFKNLGLLIIDEEQRFGVEHKEKLRLLREELDTLILSATPIPRTLALSIYGTIDISRIRTPPLGRKEKEVILVNYSLIEIKRAIERELKRGGQVLYIRNRISPLKEIKEKIKSLFPDVECEILHAKKSNEEIENILVNFILGKIKILIATNILETGMDFDNANTLIVERPDLFGLSELYALKGRVGRRDKKSYVYFLLPHKLSERARERIITVKRYNYPGAGEKVALKDLEMRGPGELFGKKQKGFLKGLSITFYLRLLEEEIKKLKGETLPKRKVDIIPYSSLYFPSYLGEEDKIFIARSLFTAESVEEIDCIIDEYKDRFGKPDDSTLRIFKLAYAFLKAKKENISKIKIFKDYIYTE
ncbi:MAG: DEAD/DEAH box helicase [Candidatus Hydrothermales bacterium]